MDKNTLSNYGWVVIAVLVLAVMIALATPFGTYIRAGVESTTAGLFDTSEKAMNVVGMSAGNGSFDDGTGSSTPTKDPALNPSEIVPENATYKQGSTTYNAGNSFPETVADGDIYTYGDYKYTYNTNSNGWAVSIYDDDRYQTSYGAILESINGQLVTSMQNTFWDCPALTTAPVIPSSVTNMSGTFWCCTSLTTAPAVPNGVMFMYETFMGCTALTTAPVIPNSVTDMSNTFNGCHALTDTITINATPKYYDDCLYGTQITEILGDCTIKAEILATK